MSWSTRIVLSLLVIAAAYAACLIAKRVVCRRLAALARRTDGSWDDAIVAEIQQRVPVWSLLLGTYLAAGFWTLPPNVRTALNGTLFVLVVGSLTLMAAGLLAGFARQYGHAVQEALPVTTLTENIVRIAVMTVGFLVILNGLGLSITPILTALGVGGLAVALALQDTLANLFAGFYVTMARQIRVGDYVRLDTGEEGYLTDIAWRAARIRMLPNNTVLVPNAKLAQAIVINYHLPDKELAVLVNVGVDYESDLEQVERVTCDVARDVMRTVPGGVPQFEPFIRYHTFGESSIDFTVILRASEFVDQYLVKHEFVKRLHQRYRHEGITIPFPIRTLVQRDGETVRGFAQHS
jgi:small-conductance mechanosensitive channel